MIVADTDVLIDYLHDRGEAEAVEFSLRRGVLRTTVITRLGLLSGAKTAIPSLDLDDQAAGSASEIRRSLEHSGGTIGMADSLIAGIVLSAGGEFLTRNRRHFERVPGLKLI
jgi:predicted nucleic acid-binding protein